MGSHGTGEGTLPPVGERYIDQVLRRRYVTIGIVMRGNGGSAPRSPPESRRGWGVVMVNGHMCIGARAQARDP